jgi:hypothetical protein
VVCLVGLGITRSVSVSLIILLLCDTARGAATGPQVPIGAISEICVIRFALAHGDELHRSVAFTM